MLCIGLVLESRTASELSELQSEQEVRASPQVSRSSARLTATRSRLRTLAHLLSLSSQRTSRTDYWPTARRPPSFAAAESTQQLVTARSTLAAASSL